MPCGNVYQYKNISSHESRADLHISSIQSSGQVKLLKLGVVIVSFQVTGLKSTF